ncbi:hypothetical protein [Lacticaseibacillus parakribbianus]|uniref:hypothetical protein n=1 Tax=Lacticaseibacillus parakribbianus TaxID=2970927 RepID=UPI0021CB5BDF|nr:hypothetical protein [Lacticaseibacillus parakribbianus]
MVKTTQRFYFAARNAKTAHGYEINFVNVPHAQAVGVTYEETVYYAYRVLADFLLHLPEDAKVSDYTLRQIPESEDENVFYSLVSATPDFDPHKMTTHFTLPQAGPAEIRRQGDRLAHLVAHARDLAAL